MKFYFFSLREKFVEKNDFTKSFLVRKDKINLSVNILQYLHYKKEKSMHLT